MSKIINDNISVCNIVRDTPSEGGGPSTTIDPSTASPFGSAKERVPVSTLSTPQKREAWDTAEPIRKRQRELGGAQGEEISRKQKSEEDISRDYIEDCWKHIDNETKDMSPAEKRQYIVSNFGSQMGTVIEAYKAGELDQYIVPENEPDRTPDRDDEDDRSLQGGSAPAVDTGTSSVRRRKEERKARVEKQERERDLADVTGAIAVEAGAGIAKELATMPAGMITEVLKKLQEEGKREGRNVDLRVAIAVAGLVEQLIALPFNVIMNNALKKQEEFGNKYKDEEFLALLAKGRDSAAAKATTSRRKDTNGTGIQNERDEELIEGKTPDNPDGGLPGRQ